MKKLLCMLLLMTALVSCGESDNSSSESSEQESSAVVTETTETSETTEESTAEESKADSQDGTVVPVEVVEDGMVPVYADQLKDGVYQIEVSSSSSMFNIDECELTVQDGEMSAVMTMSGTGYRYIFMGTGEQAESADESEYIPFEETDGVHKYIVPVEALDMGIDCTAFSDRKEKWYDRTILFRADSLPVEAFSESTMPELADGEYTVDVTLEGGSGRASINSPAKITVADGNITVEIIWNSNNYDYMIVDSEKYLPVSTEEFSVFEIPVLVFDRNMAVSADTTAMSTPHEIDYTLYFDSSTIAE
ncbi:MAG: hypothetical protein NC177_08655 [Ruminococcus flavefaciens]|nr:hypothetical protein [Ruminococcus flavefaciens]